MNNIIQKEKMTTKKRNHFIHSGRTTNRKTFHAKWTEWQLHTFEFKFSAIVVSRVYEKGQKIHLKYT